MIRFKESVQITNGERKTINTFILRGQIALRPPVYLQHSEQTNQLFRSGYYGSDPAICFRVCSTTNPHIEAAWRVQALLHTNRMYQSYAPVHVNHAPPPPKADPKNSNTEKVCQNLHLATSFHCQNPLTNNLHFYHV